MTIGLYRHWGVYEMRVDADFSGVDDPTAGGSIVAYAEEYTQQAEDAFSPPVRAISMVMTQSRDGAGPDIIQYEVTIRGVYHDLQSSLTFAPNTYMRLVFNDLKLWWNGVNWKLTWDSIEHYNDSTLVNTITAGEQVYTFWQSKCAIPLLGVQPTLAASFLAESPTSPASAGGINGVAVASTGWRFQFPGSGTWQTPPVTTNCLPVGEVSGCPAGSIPHVLPTATNTWDGRVEASVTQTFDGSGNPLTTEGYGFDLTLADNCPSSVELMGDDYAAVLYRGGMPRTEHLQEGTCVSGGSTTTTSTYTEEHPLMSELLLETTDVTDAIFDQFGYDLIAPYGGGATIVDIPGGSSHTGTVRFPARCTFDGTELGYYRSTRPIVAYLNYWGARHQHLLYWIPDIEGAGVQWPVNGAEPSLIEYWLLLAKQWRYHTAFAGNGAQTQVNVPWAPFLKGLAPTGLHIAVNIFGNGPTSFVGLHNFESQTPTIPASVQLDSDSEDAWSLTDCTAVFGSDIVLSRTGSVTEYSLTFDAGKFGVEPYLYPHIAESVTVDWVLTNVSNIDVYIVDSLGKETLVTSGPPPVTHAFSTSQDEYYAGSWAQDHGGLAVSNFGVDQEPSGQSLAHMSSPEFVQTFQMFTGRGAHKLKFVVTPTNPAVSVTLKYPTYTYCDNPDPVFVPENSAQTAILWPDGPGVRWGQWNWFYGGDVQDTPIVRTSTDRSSALDWLVTRRVLFEGKAGTDGLDAEIGTLFDADEGTTREDVADKTLAFWIPA